MKKIRVAVLMGGKSAEHEVSLSSGREVIKNLDPKKYETIPLVISRDGKRWQLANKELLLKEKKHELKFARELVPLEIGLPQNLQQKKIDVVFIAMHGPFGEDGTIQGMLELTGLPYTGSKVLASALGMNKIMSKKIWKNEKIPVIPYFVLDKNDKIDSVLKKVSFPFIVKPSDQGSSVGVSIIHKKGELEKALNLAFSYSDKVIIEKYIKGKEITCGILGNNKPISLPLIEIVPKHEFFDYACKYTPDLCEEIVPARIDKKITRKIQKIALAAYKALGCQGFGRVDMFLGDNGKIYVSEINTIPGLTANSLLPKEAKAAGISFPRLLDKIISYALKKNLA
jgi:D-alanine-D-alanine ligase